MTMLPLQGARKREFRQVVMCRVKVSRMEKEFLLQKDPPRSHMEEFVQRSGDIERTPS